MDLGSDENGFDFDRGLGWIRYCVVCSGGFAYGLRRERPRSLVIALHRGGLA